MEEDILTSMRARIAEIGKTIEKLASDTVSELSQTAKEAHFNKGKALSEKGLFEEALQSFRRAI